MLHRIKTLLQDKAIYIAIISTIAIACLSLFKINVKVEVPISSPDKLGHGIAYFFLMLSWLYTFIKKKEFTKYAVYSFIGCLVYGIVIEVLQGKITSYRTASYLDIVANSIGIVVAILLFNLIEKKIRLI